MTVYKEHLDASIAAIEATIELLKTSYKQFPKPWIEDSLESLAEGRDMLEGLLGLTDESGNRLAPVSGCMARHVLYDPALWMCPKCGAGADAGFVIDAVVPEAHEDCDRLHADDEVVCGVCGYTAYGTEVSRALKRP